MVESVLDGGCQCGAIRYRVSGQPAMAAIGHCTMCRRANAAPAVAWAMFREAQVAFLKGSPTTYASSPEARRGFCPACGTQICFTAEYIPGLIDLTIGSLDHPEMVAPICITGTPNGCLWSISPTTCPSSRSSRRSSEGLARRGPRPN